MAGMIVLRSDGLSPRLLVPLALARQQQDWKAVFLGEPDRELLALIHGQLPYQILRPTEQGSPLLVYLTAPRLLFVHSAALLGTELLQQLMTHEDSAPLAGVARQAGPLAMQFLDRYGSNLDRGMQAEAGCPVGQAFLSCRRQDWLEGKISSPGEMVFPSPLTPLAFAPVELSLPAPEELHAD